MINTANWKEFHLYDDHMFNIDMGNKFDRSKMNTIKHDINFVGRTAKNNGINATCGIYENTKPYDAGCLTLALGGSVGSCFVQESSFYTSQNVVVLIPKDNISIEAKQFVATVIRKESNLHYQAFIKELNKYIKTDFVVTLPATSTGIPDWDYMESYMKTVMENSKKNLKNLKMVI